MADESASEDADRSNDAPSLLGRSLYGGVLAYMAVDGFKNNDKRVAVAEEKGVPMPDALVPFVTGMLLVANLGIVLWRLPRAAAGALVVFFLGTTPAIHDFWTMEGKERQGNKINFLKNLALLGGALVFLDAASGGDEGSESDAEAESDEERGRDVDGGSDGE
ncbi:DoxX family membrane protein [Halorubrum sp. 2020YC2]|uniref:DoxX family protein n=1 Tax=Halorubrum sp. 2020YC2 TaxID=2836432 RepID=UPI001BE5FFA4|nr:DoxX family membrane protein [Halorubrum sp. 2020YC2]QWC19124.1 DoxX family membrane protein [Halorubrum sp. 2020YC2]